MRRLVLFLLSIVCAYGVFIGRDNEDWALLSFEKRGIIQNYVKCKHENHDKCDVDPRYIRSPYTQTILSWAPATIDLVKKNPKFHENARVLIIGMGPATMGRFWHHHFPNMQVDHVEINEELVRDVNETLPLPISPKFHIFVEDGLRFVQRQASADSHSRQKYDIIVHDAYDSVGPVGVLNTLSFFNGLRKLLEDEENGIVVANVWVLNVTLAREIAMKYKEVFGNVRITGVPPTPNMEANCAIIAHSMIRKDDLSCTDKVCKSKRSKASRSKVSPICQDISEHTKVGRDITTDNNLVWRMDEVIEQGWAHRPFPYDESFC